MSTNNGTELATRTEPQSMELSGRILDTLVGGDLAALGNDERLQFVDALCHSMGLNSLSNPFAFIRLNGRLTLYATKDCAAQLRKIHGVSIEIVEQRVEDGLLTVHVRAKDRTGKTDEDMGVLPVAGLKGENLANAIMKAVTKAKRRVTLSICGLGILDESEIEGASIGFDGSRIRGPRKVEEVSPEMQEAFDRLAAAVHALHPKYENHTGEQLALQKHRKLQSEDADPGEMTPEMVNGWAADLEQQAFALESSNKKENDS